MLKCACGAYCVLLHYHNPGVIYRPKGEFIMEIVFKAEEIIGLAIMMNNGTIPFMGVGVLLPQGVENVFKWKPSFLFDKVVKENTKRFQTMGILESYEFTNLACTILKANYQISIGKSESKEDDIQEAIFLSESSAGRMIFSNDGTYKASDGHDPKKLVADFAKKAKDGGYAVFLKEQQSKPVVISADDIVETFNLIHL